MRPQRVDPSFEPAHNASKAYSKLGSDLLPRCHDPAFAGLYFRVVGEQALLVIYASPEGKVKQSVKDRFFELNQVQQIYGMYGAALGDGEGAFTLAEGFLKYGNWSPDEMAPTRSDALRLVKIAIAAAEQGGDKSLLKAAKKGTC